MFDKNSVKTVGHDEYPFYDQTQKSSSNDTLRQRAGAIPQGIGSNLDADTIQGLQAVTAHVAGPNKLVATDANGKLPAGIIPP